MQRLRVFDLNTPWFWFVWFWYGRRGTGKIMEVLLYPGHTFERFWVHALMRETYDPAPTGFALVDSQEDKQSW
jgi:hypothetical protein